MHLLQQIHIQLHYKFIQIKQFLTFNHWSQLIIVLSKNSHVLIRNFFCFQKSIPFLNIHSFHLFSLSFILLILNISQQIISFYLYYHSNLFHLFFQYYQLLKIDQLNLTFLQNVSMHFDTNILNFYNHLIYHSISLNLLKLKIFHQYQLTAHVNCDILMPSPYNQYLFQKVIDNLHQYNYKLELHHDYPLYFCKLVKIFNSTKFLFYIFVYYHITLQLNNMLFPNLLFFPLFYNQMQAFNNLLIFSQQIHKLQYQLFLKVDLLQFDLDQVFHFYFGKEC